MTDREYEHLLALRKCGEWKLTDLLWARYKELELKYRASVEASCKDSGREDK